MTIAIDSRELVLPLFVREGLTSPAPIVSMPGVVQHSLSSMKVAVAEAARLGLGGVMLFGVPDKRDAIGSEASNPEGILAQAVRTAVTEVGDAITVQADLCLDEFTDHGHCGVLSPDGEIDLPGTLARYRAMGVVLAEAGVHMVGLSGMMLGQTVAVRGALDGAGFTHTRILAYSAKFASAMYGPFRDAVESTYQGGLRSYQLDPSAGAEGVRRAAIDVAEGADIVMVKPAGGYLDVLAEVAHRSTVPVWAYQVSGEYAAIEAAAGHGWIDRRRAVLESLTGIRRAGATGILTYWAAEVAAWIAEEHA